MIDYRSIEFNLSIGCPIQCNYCPQSTLMKSDYGISRLFDINDLSKIIENAAEDRTIEVFFAGFSEPLHIKNFIDYTDFCESSSLVSRFVLFTTGYKITEEQIKKFSTYKKFKINFHVGNPNMINFDKSFWDKLEIVAKYLPDATFLEVGEKLDDFSEQNILLDKFKLKYQFQKIIGRAGNLKGFDFQEVKYAVTCEKMSYKKRPVILPDGTALACANDYGCEMKLGNLLTQKWSELDFDKIIKMQKKCDSGLPCFRDCHLAVRDKQFKSFL